jgi:hypothetical protein
MSMTIDQVLEAIYPEEPSYVQAAELGPDALPLLDRIAQGDDPMLASKAVYLAGSIGGGESLEILKKAVKSREVTIRIAAAAATALYQPQQSKEILSSLLRDKDINVRKVALQSVIQLKIDALSNQVQELSDRDPEEFIRNLANETRAALQRR